MYAYLMRTVIVIHYAKYTRDECISYYMTVRRSGCARTLSSKSEAIFNDDAAPASARRPLDGSFQFHHLFRLPPLLEAGQLDTFSARFSLALDQFYPLLARGLPFALQNAPDGLWANLELIRQDGRGEHIWIKAVELAEAVHGLPGQFFGWGPAGWEALLEGLAVGFVFVGRGVLWRRSLVGRRGAWPSAVDDLAVLAEIEFSTVFAVILQNWFWAGDAVERPF